MNDNEYYSSIIIIIIPKRCVVDAQLIPYPSGFN